MKKILFILLFLSMAGFATAQNSGGSKSKNREAVAIGIRGGASLPNYQYTDNPDLNALPFDADLMQRIGLPTLGLQVEIPLLNGRMYVAPEADFTVRGDDRLFHNDNLNTDVNYRARVNYLEARLPIAVAFPATTWLKPYVFAAPSFGLALPTVGPFTSEITQSYANGNPTETVAVDSSNMAPYDIGVLAGAGLRFNINFTDFSLVVKVEAGYHLGFLDTYSEQEHYNQSTAINLNQKSGHQYNVIGQRLNRGFEAAVTIALPLRFSSDDACVNWSSGSHRPRRNQHYGF